MSDVVNPDGVAMEGAERSAVPFLRPVGTIQIQDEGDAPAA
eukprot:CAMPEP_0174703956 /NCGR_PEP_ID=MMETSP1094-20130205/7725_1 /TAXON_ID=156173 /ORGANISM="Chrysochromulina brevifilum, Strain UTEX LB 985" /LENGTH=40 /DNA_ID= /DNA_START= /DNA_END= /DNA_ORIENTATION=